MKLKSTIIGVAEIKAALKAMPAKVEKRVVDGALRAGAREFRDDIAMTSPYKRLRKSVVVKTATRSERRNDLLKGEVYVGFTGTAARFAHLPEFGTGPRVRKNGGSTGSMPANPTVRPSFDRRKEAAAKAAEIALGKGVEREAKKLAKK